MPNIVCPLLRLQTAIDHNHHAIALIHTAGLNEANRVNTLAAAPETPTSLCWDGRDGRGVTVPAEIYWCLAGGEQQRLVRRIARVR